MSGLCAVQEDVRFRDSCRERLDAVLLAWRLTGGGLRALPFADYLEMADAAMRDRRREAQAARQNAAFTAWLQGAGGDKAWGAFCRYYGLAEPETARPGKKVNPEEEKAWAERIRKNMKRHGGNFG